MGVLSTFLLSFDESLSEKRRRTIDLHFLKNSMSNIVKRFIFIYDCSRLIFVSNFLSLSVIKSILTFLINKMASATEKKSCIKCWKGQRQTLCDECQQYFCMKHLLQHRQELSQQMDDLTFTYNEIQ